MKIIYFLVCFLFIGCASYRIPIQVENHPASSDARISQIQLSPILDLAENKPIDSSEKGAHVHK